MLCYAMLCYAMLCYALLCDVTTPNPLGLRGSWPPSLASRRARLQNESKERCTIEGPSLLSMIADLAVGLDCFSSDERLQSGLRLSEATLLSMLQHVKTSGNLLQDPSLLSKQNWMLRGKICEKPIFSHISPRRFVRGKDLPMLPLLTHPLGGQVSKMLGRDWHCHMAPGFFLVLSVGGVVGRS